MASSSHSATAQVPRTARIARPWDSPARCIADTLSAGARAFATLARGSLAVGPRAHVATYRGELAPLLVRAGREPRAAL
jgi:hypothetical protein